MNALPTLVVAGVPNLAGALRNTALFPVIHEASSATGLRGLVTGPELRGTRPDHLVFIIGDALVDDDPNLSLVEFLRKLTNAGYQVIVVSVTARGAELQRQNPRSQLLTLPLRVNSVLYALANFGYDVQPVADGGVEINVSGAAQSAGMSAPATPVFQPNPPAVQSSPPARPAESGWQRVGVDDVAPISRNPEPAPTLNQPGPVAPAAASAAPQPFGGSPMPGSDWVPPGRRSLADLAAAQGQAPAAPQQQTTPFQPATPPFQPAAPQYPAAQNRPGSDWSAAPQGAAPSFNPAGRVGAAPTQARQGRRGYVTTISVSKGGTGKSSMTLNLAAFLGMRLRSQGKTVCVIDANTQQSDASKYPDIYTPNINTIANDPSLLTPERILSGLVHKPEYNISVLLGPPTPDEANPLSISARLYSQVLELLKQHYDYIFIDTPVAEKFHEMFSDFALPRADYIIVPVAPNFTTLHNADNWLRAAVTAPKHEGGAGIDRNRIGVVLNRAEDGIGCSEADVRATMANWHFIGAVPETKEWKAANNANELVAPKNFANLSHAFAEVLHAATREPALLENFATLDAPRPKRGILSRLRGN